MLCAHSQFGCKGELIRLLGHAVQVTDRIQAILVLFLHGTELNMDSDDLAEEWDGYDINIDEEDGEGQEDDQETETGCEESDKVEVLTLEREINKMYHVSAAEMAIGKSALSRAIRKLALAISYYLALFSTI